MTPRKTLPTAAYGRWGGNLRITDDHTGHLVDWGPVTFEIMKAEGFSDTGKYVSKSQDGMFDREGFWVSHGGSLKLTAAISLVLPEVGNEWGEDGLPKRIILSYLHVNATVEKCYLERTSTFPSGLPGDDFIGSLHAPIEKAALDDENRG